MFTENFCRCCVKLVVTHRSPDTIDIYFYTSTVLIFSSCKSILYLTYKNIHNNDNEMKNQKIQYCLNSYRFGALKSDSTHHFFRNACTKSGSLRFSQFSGCWLILSVYILMKFWLSLCKIVRSSVILILPYFR